MPASVSLPDVAVAVATGGHVTLSCSTAFAAFWMVPRMAELRADLPEIDLRIQTAKLTPQETAYGVMESARVFFAKMKR